MTVNLDPEKQMFVTGLLSLLHVSFEPSDMCVSFTISMEVKKLVRDHLGQKFQGPG